MRRVRRIQRRGRLSKRRGFGRLSKRSSSRRGSFMTRSRRPRKRTAFQMKKSPAVHLSKGTTGYVQVGTSRTILATSTSVGSQYSPTWSIIPDNSSLSNVFKYYRLNKIYMEWNFNIDMLVQSSSATASALDVNQRGRIYIIPDPRHIINPSTVTEAELQEMGGDVRKIEVKALLNNSFKFKTNLYSLYPGAILSSGGAVGQNHLFKTKQWFDVNANNVLNTWGHIIHFVGTATFGIEQRIPYVVKQYFSVRGNK